MQPWWLPAEILYVIVSGFFTNIFDYSILGNSINVVYYAEMAKYTKKVIY